MRAARSTARHAGAAAPSPAETPDVSKLLRDARAGSSAASVESKARQSLGEENAQLRREVAELRQQLLSSLNQPISTNVTDVSEIGANWMLAQLEQSKRQLQVLSDALIQRGEICVELETILLKLRQPSADGKRSEDADWAASALRRLRHVQFAEEFAGNLRQSVSQQEARGCRRSSTGRGPGEAGRAKVVAPA